MLKGRKYLTYCSVGSIVEVKTIVRLVRSCVHPCSCHKVPVHIDRRVERAAMLSYIKIKNFKTYRGDIVVGPLRKLTVVLGRNGSGKITDYTL
jgi:hypothetical protein